MQKQLIIIGAIIFLSARAFAQQKINEVLTVNTSGPNTIRVENDVAGEEATIRLRSKPNNGSGWLHSDISVYATGSNTGYLGFKVPADNAFGMGFGMIFNSSGNIGLGTLNPNARITIKGDGATTGTAAINFRHAGNGMSIGLSSTSNNLLIGNSWNPESGTYLTIQDVTGNVGIGATNPNATLQIGDSDHTGTPRSEVEKKRLSIAPVTHSGSDWFFTSRDNNNANLDIGYSDNKALTLRHDGNVGIGTAVPEARLHIYKNATTGNWGSNTLSNAGIRIQDSGASLYLDGNSLYTNAVMNIGTVNNNFLSLGTNNTERVRINANGSVGIGTAFTGPHKLAVDGSIGAREVKVEMTQWQDQVFSHEYDLRTIEDLENYIAENKHLPEIPSEAEVIRNGINLGEMDAKLLQKIEELTLYMIQMNREMAELKARNGQLEKEISVLKNE